MLLGEDLLDPMLLMISHLFKERTLAVQINSTHLMTRMFQWHRLKVTAGRMVGIHTSLFPIKPHRLVHHIRHLINRNGTPMLLGIPEMFLNQELQALVPRVDTVERTGSRIPEIDRTHLTSVLLIAVGEVAGVVEVVAAFVDHLVEAVVTIILDSTTPLATQHSPMLAPSIASL